MYCESEFRIVKDETQIAKVLVYPWDCHAIRG
jgi:hypothetical protein